MNKTEILEKYSKQEDKLLVSKILDNIAKKQFEGFQNEKI